MKKKILILGLVILLSLINIGNEGCIVYAEEIGEDIDYSYLLTDNALVDYAEIQTRGIYLLSGESIINKISSIKIGAGGVTNAAIKCKVAVTAIVERKNDAGNWVRVTSWTNTVESGYSAAVSKSLIVGTGYYYRVRSSHYASSDASSSCTSSLKM